MDIPKCIICEDESEFGHEFGQVNKFNTLNDARKAVKASVEADFKSTLNKIKKKKKKLTENVLLINKKK